MINDKSNSVVTVVKDERMGDQEQDVKKQIIAIFKKLLVDQKTQFEMACKLLTDKNFVKKFKAAKDTDIVELWRDGSYRIYQGAIIEDGTFKVIVDSLFWSDPRILARKFCGDFPDRAKCECLTDSIYCNDFFQQLGQSMEFNGHMVHLSKIITDLIYPENKKTDVSQLG